MKRHQTADHLLNTFLTLLLLHTTTTATALTLPLHPPTNISSPFPPPIRHCVADPTWSQYHHNIAPSCETALQSLLDDQSTYGPEPGTFISTPARSWASFPSVPHSLSLPIRYQSGQCVVAVVMVKMLVDRGVRFPELPRGRSWPYADMVGWGELGVEGGYVRATCGNGVGYAVVGREGGVAVVVVETGSWWDRCLGGLEGERIGVA